MFNLNQIKPFLPVNLTINQKEHDRLINMNTTTYHGLVENSLKNIRFIKSKRMIKVFHSSLMPLKFHPSFFKFIIHLLHACWLQLYKTMN